MSIDSDQKRLSQSVTLRQLTCSYSASQMVTVYQSKKADAYNHGIYCALIPSTQIERTLKSPNWDLMHGDGLPTSVVKYSHDDKCVKYLRFGKENGVEPLIIARYFDGLRNEYREIAEEFRLFHRLYHDQKLNQYIKFDEGGNEIVVATVESSLIQIRLKEIRQFLALKEMHLSIQFDHREFSRHSLAELDLSEKHTTQSQELSCWGLGYGDMGLGRQGAFSRLNGIRLIEPFPKDKSGFWGFSPEPVKQYVDFIIDVNEEGEDITHTSNPDNLDNYFDANPGAPHYLTQVHFKKQVLDKYYSEPSKYSVEDGFLRCASLWGMTLDNHHEDKVCAWLGDLGRDLPYEDQLHWRTHNIQPSGEMSTSFIRRQILGQAVNSNHPEHIFQERYDELGKICSERWGWQLLLSPNTGDIHLLQNIRVPATNEQKDFDEFVLALAKVLIDSLNEKQLNKFIPKAKCAGLKGSISRLEWILTQLGVPEIDDHISFIRKLQNLRSSGTAHRKGKNYQKIAKEFDIDNQDLRSVSAEILDRAVDYLNFLIRIVYNKRLKEGDDPFG